MNDYTFEITDSDYWRVEKGYSKNNGKDLDFDRLENDLFHKIRLKELVVSGNILVNFGSIDNNSNVSLLVATKTFQLKQNVAQVVGNKDPKKRLRGNVVCGVKVRSKEGVLPYRWRT